MLQRLCLTLCFFALVFFSPGTRAASARDEWVKIGSIETTAGANSARLVTALGSRRFKAVRVAVANGAVRITRVAVNGGSGELTGRSGGRLVQFAGGAHPIDQVAVSFQTKLAPGTKFTIEVFALEVGSETAETSKDKPSKKKAIGASKFDNAIGHIGQGVGSAGGSGSG